MPPWDKYRVQPMTTIGGATPAGQIAGGNIDLAARPVVKNGDGTISTVRSMSFNEDGKEILVPTVSPDGRIMSDDEAIDRYRKTGENLGVFDSPDDATRYAESLHDQQDQMYSPKPAGPWARYSQQSIGTPKAPEFDGGMAGAAALGAGDTLSFGFGDELGAGLGATSEYLASFLTGEEPRSYSELLGKMRDQESRAKETNPGSFLTGQIAGGLAGGTGLARGGLSATANAIGRGAGLGRVAATSAVEGAGLGALQGFGSGEGVDGRLKSGTVGLVAGGALGGVTPLAIAGAQQVGGMAAAPISARVFPQRYAERALGEGVRRSGQTVDEIADGLGRARADGQDMFTVADAMGNAGQRMLSTVARTPHNERQAVIEALQGRQVGQGDRLSSYLAEGFGAPDTAAQRAARLTAERSAAANANYGSARDGAGSVDPTRAIALADDFLGTAGSLPRTNIADDSIEGAVTRARSYLTDGQSLVSDFGTALRSKQELDALIERGSPSVQRVLIPIRNELDGALEQASPAYANARNTFRQQSQAIDAVDTGRSAASGRMRSADTIPQFRRMRPDQQDAFRPGYVDPLIARIESSSMSPTTNKARGLITPKTSEEFPAFALPDRADQMGNRIAREQRMFETSNAALGGSKTADNLADAAEMSRFDPGVMSSLMRFDVPGALMSGVRRVMSEGAGTPPRVVEQLARALMESDPAAARAVLQGGQNRVTNSDELRARIISALMGSTSAGAGRIAAP